MFGAGCVLGAWLVDGADSPAVEDKQETGFPPPEVVWSSLQLETEACRRRLSGGGAVFSGPVRVVRSASEAGGIASVWYEVPVWMGEGAGGGLVPLRGEVWFVVRGESWGVHDRHLRHWRRAGLLPDGI